SPTRRLAGTPFALALKTGSPLDMLQLVYGATWLAGGLLTYAILLRLFPREKWLAFVAGCLTLTATGDFLTDSLVALHYEIAAAALTRMNLLARGELIGRLFLHNFNPWAWGPARANWFASVGPVISQGLRVALAATACLAFLSVALVLWRDRRARGEGGDPTS